MLTRLALLIFWISLYLVKQLLPSYEMNIESCQPKGGCFDIKLYFMEKNHTHIMHLFIYNILIYCSIYQNAFFFNKFKFHLLQLIAYI
jgi:hypothetical protein